MFGVPEGLRKWPGVLLRTYFFKPYADFPCGNVPILPGAYRCLPFFAKHVFTIGGTQLLRSCLDSIFLATRARPSENLRPLCRAHSWDPYTELKAGWKAGCRLHIAWYRMPQCFFNAHVFHTSEVATYKAWPDQSHEIELTCHKAKGHAIFWSFYILLQLFLQQSSITGFCINLYIFIYIWHIFYSIFWSLHIVLLFKAR